MTLEFENGLTALRKEKQQVEADVAAAKDALSRSSRDVEDSTRRQQELLGRIAPLEQMLDRVSAGLKAVEARAAEARDVIGTATAALDKLQKRLDDAVPATVRTDVQAAIDAENAAVAGLEAGVAKLRGETAAAEAEESEARKRMSAAAERLRAAVAAPSKTAGEIQTAGQETTQKASAAESAGSTADFANAFVAAAELRQSIDDLKRISGSDPKPAQDEIDAAWKEYDAASADLQPKSDAVANKRSDLAAAEIKLQSKRTSRDADLRAAIAAVQEAADRAAAPPAAGAPAAKRASRRDTRPDRRADELT
jgi:chromosome segregation ATPase